MDAKGWLPLPLSLRRTGLGTYLPCKQIPQLLHAKKPQRFIKKQRPSATVLVWSRRFFFCMPKVLLNLTESMWEKTRSHSMGVMSFLNQYFIFSRTSSMTRTIKVEVLTKKNNVIHRFISPGQSAAFQKDFWSYSTLHAGAVQLLGCPAASVLKPHLSRILLMALLWVSPDTKLSPDLPPRGAAEAVPALLVYSKRNGLSVL